MTGRESGPGTYRELLVRQPRSVRNRTEILADPAQVGSATYYREVSGYLVGSAAFKAVGMGDPHPAGSIPVHLRSWVHGCSWTSTEIALSGAFVPVRSSSSGHVALETSLRVTRGGVDSKGLGTHAGRRSVVTNLFASGSLDLEDVARFVGHTDTATTRGYVQHEGDRPRQTSVTALELPDPNWSPEDSEDG